MITPHLYYGTNATEHLKSVKVDRMFGPPTVESVTDLVGLLWEPSFQPVTLGLGPLCQATRGSLDKLLKVLESDCPNGLVLWANTLEGVPDPLLSRVKPVYVGESTSEDLADKAYQLLTFATSKEVWKFDSVVAGLVEYTSLRDALVDCMSTSSDFMCVEAYEALRTTKNPSVWDIKVALCMY